MKAAIYYPYLRVQTRGLMKHALLFWDQLEVITPFERAESPDDKELAAATEILVKPCVPSDEQKEEAHIQLMALVSRPLPPWFYFQSEQPKEWIYAEKFSRKTWQELRERGLASLQHHGARNWEISPNCSLLSTAKERDGIQYWSSDAFSMLMMSVLADCCAGQTKVTATDQPAAYGTLGNCLAIEGGTTTRTASEGERAIVSCEILSPSLKNISLSQLIKLREREAGARGYQYRELRHKLFARMASFSEEMAKPIYNESDRTELQRQFKDEFDADSADLRNELGMSGRGWLFSRDIEAFVSAIVKAGVKGITGDFAGSMLALGAGIPLVRATDNYKAARFKALKGHFSSFLYLAEQAGRVREL
jgi:hypothetical protein